MRKAWVRALQAAAAIAVIAIVTRQVVIEWDRLRDQPINWVLRWDLIALSLVVTWLMYLLLIHAWRAVLLAWGEHMQWRTAIRIWFVSSLGKYIPGKLWALAAMAIMAERAGVSGAAATASSVVMQLVSITTGVGIAVALVGAAVMGETSSLGVPGVIAMAVASIGATALVASPAIMGRLGRLIGRPDGLRHVGARALALATLPSVVAWLGYGTALYVLVLGTLPSVSLGWSEATGAFAASYIAGYLAVIAPGGLGVRESVLVLLLEPRVGLANALAIAFASRLTLTINELGAALPLLVFGRTSRDIA